MIDQKGVEKAQNKKGQIYYRSSITYKNKHISLGSYDTPETAHTAYEEASKILFDSCYTLYAYNEHYLLPFEKWIILHNFRDTGYYIGKPIYLHKYYFSYFLDLHTELKFDTDDLFYYASHKIHRRKGYFFVNDYGQQRNILCRYGIRNFAVENVDFLFKNGDCLDFRHYNIEIINKYNGVTKEFRKEKTVYVTRINLSSTLVVGVYPTQIDAAVAYNKAVDFAISRELTTKNFEKNYILEITSEQYKDLYRKVKISTNLENPTMQKRPMGIQGYTGVFQETSGFRAYIGYQSKVIYLGMYPTAKQAAQAYNQAALLLWGSHSKLNHVLPTVHASDLDKIIQKIQKIFPDL